ncbi:hypothetical protein CRG98_040524 [Punica granatum]|uniref:Uncharacterized protein n=1 Tax=Punica granatum TaxID=22663 RepID=A0A2I0I5Z6_PUNGR|nr:hypothetical protein CRG98_040524 [Punica granatum]
MRNMLNDILFLLLLLILWSGQSCNCKVRCQAEAAVSTIVIIIQGLPGVRVSERLIQKEVTVLLTTVGRAENNILTAHRAGNPAVLADLLLDQGMLMAGMRKIRHSAQRITVCKQEKKRRVRRGWGGYPSQEVSCRNGISIRPEIGRDDPYSSNK